MVTKLEKELRREIEVDGAAYVVTIGTGTKGGPQGAAQRP
jgi:hypothetical protein